MPTARETVQAYFDSLVTGDSETLSAMMLPASHYVKIGTDADEVVEGSEEIAAYYRDHAASTEDFSIEFIKLDVQERDHVAWFYTRQVWRLEWRGAREEFAMRMTGVLEKDRRVVDVCPDPRLGRCIAGRRRTRPRRPKGSRARCG